MRKYLTAFFSLLLIGTVTAQMPQHTTPRLVSSASSISAGAKFYIGIEYKMDPGWHIYWQNPGEAGMATSVRFFLPDGFKVSDLKWPYPHNFVAGGIANFGYEHEVVLIAEVTTPKVLHSKSLKILAKTDWLECKEACLPGGAKLELSIPLQNDGEPSRSKDANIIEKYLDFVPISDPALKVKASRSGNYVKLIVDSAEFTNNEIISAEFFPYEGGIFDAGESQNFRFAKNFIELDLKLELLRTKEPKEINGVLVYQSSESSETKSKIIKSVIN